MSKSISTEFAADLRRGLQTLAVLIEIKRGDGTVYRHTNHDTSITFQEKVYDHTIPFILSAFQSGSNLAVDNTELELQIDGTVFTESDFRNGAFENAEIDIFQVDFNTPDNGRMSMRKGWFGKVEHNKNSVAKIEINGLLKILDFQVGRIYQPACDADLGDARCRVAIDMSQARSYLNRYGVGDWVYWYDTASMSPLTITNGDFEADGEVTNPATPITGWIKPTSSKWSVRLVSLNDMPANPGGLRMLEGDTDADPAGEEQYIFQDIDFATDVGDDAAIDDGQIIAAFFVEVGQSFYLLDKPRILIETFDANGDIVESRDTGYFTLDRFNAWREKAVVFNVLPGTRTMRIYLYGLRADDDKCNVAFANVRGYYWNHTITFPFSDLIHKVSRIRLGTQDEQSRPLKNGSFQKNAPIANSSTQNIPDWTKGSGDFWAVATSIGGGLVTPPDGTHFLVGGDSGSGVQETYTISQTYDLVSVGGLDVTRIALGKIAGTFASNVSFGDTDSAVQITVEFYNTLNVLVLTYDHIALTTGDVGTLYNESAFAVPVSARTAKVILTAVSPVGQSLADVAFDNLRFRFYDYERPAEEDPVLGVGREDTLPEYSAGAITIDGSLLWKAHAFHHQFDEVASVTDNKVFTGTNITGIDGAYETSLIRWISGDNAGSRNLIRKWDSATKGIKLYFPTVQPIQVGDRFVYVRACQKEFLGDCRLRFDNAINFQGFPDLPSKIV